MSPAVISRFRRCGWVPVATAFLVLMSACQLDAHVEVTVEPDGSGLVVVTVDADDDAVDLVPELASGLQLDDITAAGWTVSNLESSSVGGVRIAASKEFDSAGQLQAVLDEIAGTNVIFSEVALVQSRSFGRVSWDFNANINPSPPLEAFSDPNLAAALDGEYFGRPLEDLLADAGAPEDLFGLEFTVTLPGNIAEPSDDDDTAAAADTADDDDTAGEADTAGDDAGEPDAADDDDTAGVDAADDDTSAVDTADDDDAAAADDTAEAAADLPESVGEIAGQTGSWQFSYGDAPVTVSVLAISETSTPGTWRNFSRWAAIAFAALLLVSMAVVIRAMVRTPKGRGRLATRRRRKRAAVREAEVHKPRKRLLRLLVVDAHGVIVRPTDPINGLLLPTILREQPDIDPDLVRDRHRKLLLGRLTPEEFWSDLGLGPIGQGMETRYLSSYRLVPGLHDFLDRVAARKLPVAVVGNQPRKWGERLRRMAQLEDSTALWLTSGEVGAALPQPSLLEAARRKMSVDAHDCLYLSSVPEFLDTAEKLGMATAYFAVSPDDVQETKHTLVRGYKDILRGSS